MDSANALVMITLEALSIATDMHLPFVLEFPEDLGIKKGRKPASLWQLQEIKRLGMRASAHRLALHQSWFGTPYSKPTGILTTCTPIREFPGIRVAAHFMAGSLFGAIAV